ncbi:hypothetical protein AGMMS49982_15040 [Bacteroidia bacterium]|nr:hypothetical protein AGMMS49982_15040 [Bacteroidia bacterium]
MKRTLIIAATAVFAATTVLSAQTQKELAKERKEISKLAKSELNDKVTKAAKKEAKKLAKAGWTISPGALPIEKQLEKSYEMQYQYDADNFPKYLMGEASTIGSNYDAAKMQALELAKQNLAGQIQTEVAALIENRIANEQSLSAGQAESLTRSVSAGKNMIMQSLGRVITVMELYRTDKKTQNKEVLMRIAYNAEMAKAAAKKAIRENLEERGDKLAKDLDKVLGF